jgi:hypothetical protein
LELVVFNGEVVLGVCMVGLLHSIRGEVADDASLSAARVEELQALV